MNPFRRILLGTRRGSGARIGRRAASTPSTGS